MRNRQVGVLILLFCLMIQQLPVAESYPYGISDVENGCTCHSAVATETVNIAFEGLPEHYEANKTYTLNISASGGAESIENHTNFGGFNLWMSHGVLSNFSADVQVFSDNEVGHTLEGNDQRAWTVNWTAPDDGEATLIRYRLHVNTVNGDGVPSDDDQWNRKFGSLTGVNGDSQIEPVSDLFLYGVPVVLLLLSGGVYYREMRKLRTQAADEEEEE
ncbi:MAG: hypothetical protein NZ802_04395 [Candidatus Poseidoniales archaeon]|nr:hypothetical protein [Candidatus Poseidoniales archaeon]